MPDPRPPRHDAEEPVAEDEAITQDEAIVADEVTPPAGTDEPLPSAPPRQSARSERAEPSRSRTRQPRSAQELREALPTRGTPTARAPRQPRQAGAGGLPRINLMTWVTALLGVIVVALLVTTISQLARNGDLEDRVDTLEEQLAAANVRANATAWILEPSPDAPSAAGASGVMFYSAREQTLSVVVYGLPPLAQGQVYQLWFLQGESDATSAGLLRIDDTGLAYFAAQNVQFESLPPVAISIEPEGGSTSLSGPTVMVGRVSAAG